MNKNFLRITTTLCALSVFPVVAVGDNTEWGKDSGNNMSTTVSKNTHYEKTPLGVKVADGYEYQTSTTGKTAKGKGISSSGEFENQKGSTETFITDESGNTKTVDVSYEKTAGEVDYSTTGSGAKTAEGYIHKNDDGSYDITHERDGNNVLSDDHLSPTVNEKTSETGMSGVKVVDGYDTSTTGNTKRGKGISSSGEFENQKGSTETSITDESGNTKTVDVSYEKTAGEVDYSATGSGGKTAEGYIHKNDDGSYAVTHERKGNKVPLK